MDEIINRLDRIEKILDKIEEKINKINNNQEKINNHMEFVDVLYNNIRKPSEFVINSICYLTGYKDKIKLPKRDDNLIQLNSDNINDID